VPDPLVHDEAKLCPACKHPGVAHDGVGCTICPPEGCDLVDEDILDASERPEGPDLAVMELDALHARAGLGSDWMASARRAELAADEAARTVAFAFCPRCDAYAHPDHFHPPSEGTSP
jgi:hypothetical protein